MSLGDKLAFERKVTDLFRSYDKPYVRGDFSAMRHGTVRADMSEGKVLVWVDDTGAPVVALHVHVAQSSGERKDSFDRTLGFTLPGEFTIKRAVCRPGMENQLASVIAELPARRVWWELWQESPALRAAARACGFRHVGTKVGTPAGELYGVWFRGEDKSIYWRDDVAQEATLNHLRVLTPTWPYGDVASGRAVVAALAGTLADKLADMSWAKHYSVYNVRNSWSAVALRGYGDVNMIGKPAEMSKEWKSENPYWKNMRLDDTSLRAALPEAEPLIDLIPGVKHRIRLMRLAPGAGELLRHSDLTDRSTGTRDGELMRIHFPLVTNPGVRFRMWNLRGDTLLAHMAVGDAWYLDSRKPHTARNDGARARLHLVMDVEANDKLRGMLGHEAVRVDEQVESTVTIEPHGLQRVNKEGLSL